MLHANVFTLQLSCIKVKLYPLHNLAADIFIQTIDANADCCLVAAVLLLQLTNVGNDGLRLEPASQYTYTITISIFSSTDNIRINRTIKWPTFAPTLFEALRLQ